MTTLNEIKSFAKELNISTKALDLLIKTQTQELNIAYGDLATTEVIYNTVFFKLDGYKRNGEF